MSLPLFLLGACVSGAGSDRDPVGAAPVPVDPRALRGPPEAPDLDPDPDVVRVRLRAAPAQVGPFQQPGYAYEDSVPGPTVRLPLGAELVVDVENGLDQPTTVHWHGVPGVPYDQDGVTWQQEPLAPGGFTQVAFRPTGAGFFWYHPHMDSERQVDLGLYGAVVVQDPADPPADFEQVLVLDAWGELERHGGGVPSLPQGWTVNGQVDPRWVVPGGSVVRLQVLNASNGGYVKLFAQGGRLVATDQARWPRSRPLEGEVLGPGDRAVVELRPGTDPIDLLALPFGRYGQETYAPYERLLELVPDPPAPAALLGDEPAAAPPTPDPGGAAVTYVLQGDETSDLWTINGEVWPEVTLASLPLGEAAVIEVRNLSATHHPFHLHGHAFEVLSVDGQPPSAQQWEDNLDLAPYQVARLLLWPELAGDWMVHCHLLDHQHGGMMTVLRLEALGDPGR